MVMQMFSIFLWAEPIDSPILSNSIMLCQYRYRSGYFYVVRGAHVQRKGFGTNKCDVSFGKSSILDCAADCFGDACLNWPCTTCRGLGSTLWNDGTVPTVRSVSNLRECTSSKSRSTEVLLKFVLNIVRSCTVACQICPTQAACDHATLGSCHRKTGPTSTQNGIDLLLLIQTWCQQKTRVPRLNHVCVKVICIQTFSEGKFGHCHWSTTKRQSTNGAVVALI